MQKKRNSFNYLPATLKADKYGYPDNCHRGKLPPARLVLGFGLGLGIGLGAILSMQLYQCYLLYLR